MEYNSENEDNEISADMFLKIELKEEVPFNETSGQNVDYTVCNAIEEKKSDINNSNAIKTGNTTTPLGAMSHDNVNVDVSKPNCSNSETSRLVSSKDSVVMNEVLHKTLLKKDKKIKSLLCLYCDYTTSAKLLLRGHMVNHKGEFCNTHSYVVRLKATSSTGDVKQKNSSDVTTKTVKKPHKCTVCGYCCARRHVLQRHMRRHTGEKPFKCSVCDKCFVYSNNLRTHLRTHTKEKPYKCTFCDYCSRQRSDLQRHMRKHTGEKPYKCSVCDYCCTQSGNLQIHMRRHTGEKPYKCTYCEYCFRQRSDLQIHMRKHTGEKPYKCVVCGYCCTVSSSLQKHMRKHTKEKPYRCTACDYSCTRYEILQRHNMQKHATAPIYLFPTAQ